MVGAETGTRGRITASLNLYVNGVYRQAISPNSRQAWNHRDATTDPDGPHAAGVPYRVSNENPVRVTGAAKVATRNDPSATFKITG